MKEERKGRLCKTRERKERKNKEKEEQGRGGERVRKKDI